MDGARGEEAAATTLVARLGDPTVSSWTVAELFVLGDRAVGPLEEFARIASRTTPERCSLVTGILTAIGTPAARSALRRVAAGSGAHAGDTAMTGSDDLAP